ncbi:uncharacterized protein LOC130673107 isoform X2 [Microplitis mediator]|uniref:uncharacterized protein LOC130673107 isoform X2 n=1 Tax=Microplitis mediator TaxID=375433 RepID=UPI002556B667|nr:uncharacterized protein LOC130673107 isoform X2 [Microplitis mediator]
MASVPPTKDTEEIQKITAGTPPSDLGQSENTSQNAAPKSGHGDAGPEVSESYRSEEQSASTADVSGDLNDRSRLSMSEKLKISEAEMREQVLTMFNNEIELEGSFNRIKDDLIKFLPAYLVDQQLSTLAELSTKSDPTKKRKTFAELFNPSEEYSAYLNRKAQRAVSNTETTRDNNEVPADESSDQSIEGSKSVEDTMRESILPMFTNEQIDEPFNKMKNTLIEKLPAFLKEQLLEALMQLSSESEPTNRKRTLENLLKPSAEYLSYSQPTATTTLQQE